MKMKVLLPNRLLTALATALWALAAVLPARADYSNTVMSLNPVAYWRLNEPVSPTLNYALGTATNSGSIGGVANGTYYHSSALQEPGVLTGDPCVKLDGTSQYIEVPHSPVLKVAECQPQRDGLPSWEYAYHTLSLSGGMRCSKAVQQNTKQTCKIATSRFHKQKQAQSPI